MIPPASQYIRLFISSIYVLHSGAERVQANTTLSTSPCIFQASSGWMQHRLEAQLPSHPSEGGEAVLTHLILYHLSQGNKAALLAASPPAFRPSASGQYGSTVPVSQ